MNKNILFDELPRTVEIHGEEWPVDYGYRASILIEIAMFSDMDDEEKIIHALNIFYLENIPPDMGEAMEQMLWFYRCGKEPEQEDENKRKGKKKSKPKPKHQHKRAYCFETDAERIYAAFRTQYGINLNKTRNKDLHWWEFMAMFDSLSEDLLISRVMYYRTADLTGMGKNQKAFIKKMREIYAIRHASSSLDDRAKLAKRNKDMKDYVRRRMEECRKG